MSTFTCMLMHLNIWPFLLHIFSVCGPLLEIEVMLPAGLTSVSQRIQPAQGCAHNLMTQLKLPVVMVGMLRGCSTPARPLKVTALWRICNELGFWLNSSGHSFSTNCTIHVDWLAYFISHFSFALPKYKIFEWCIPVAYSGIFLGTWEKCFN